MQVSEIMTRRVISVAPDESIDVAIELMLTHHVSGLPVIDGAGKLVGILTEGDLLRRPETGTERKRSSRWREALLDPRKTAERYAQSHGVRVKDMMTQSPITVAEDTPLDRVVELMETRNVKRLPVLQDNVVIGVVSRANLMRALVSIHREAPPATGGDAEIRKRILDDIEAQHWAVGVDVDVVVRNGVADVWGTVREAEQARALRALMESTPGIERVEPYISCNGELLRAP